MCLSACSRGRYMIRTDAAKEPTSAQALVRFVRPIDHGKVLNIMDDQHVIGNSYSSSQFDYLAAPGHHLFISIGDGTCFMEADLAAGKTYYVVISTIAGMQPKGFTLSPIEPDTASWENARKLEKRMKRYEPNVEAIKHWETGARAKLDWYYKSYETKKGEKDWPSLPSSYGR